MEGIIVNARSDVGEIEKHVDEAKRVVTLCNLASKVKVVPGTNGKYDKILPHIGKPKYDGSEGVDFIIERAMAETSDNSFSYRLENSHTSPWR